MRFTSIATYLHVHARAVQAIHGQLQGTWCEERAAESSRGAEEDWSHCRQRRLVPFREPSRGHKCVHFFPSCMSVSVHAYTHIHARTHAPSLDTLKPLFCASLHVTASLWTSLPCCQCAHVLGLNLSPQCEMRLIRIDLGMDLG
jgi:hypothetical protein